MCVNKSISSWNLIVTKCQCNSTWSVFNSTNIRKVCRRTLECHLAELKELFLIYKLLFVIWPIWTWTRPLWSKFFYIGPLWFSFKYLKMWNQRVIQRFQHRQWFLAGLNEGSYWKRKKKKENAKQKLKCYTVHSLHIIWWWW